MARLICRAHDVARTTRHARHVTHDTSRTHARPRHIPGRGSSASLLYHTPNLRRVLTISAPQHCLSQLCRVRTTSFGTSRAEPPSSAPAQPSMESVFNGHHYSEAIAKAKECYRACGASHEFPWSSGSTCRDPRNGIVYRNSPH